MKKIITLILSISLILTLCFSLCACGQSASPAEDFEYEFTDGTVTITGYIGTDLEIVIPDTIEERPVTVIGENAFSEYDMTSIVIPEGVTTIERNAFSQCSMLEKISFPDSLKEIYYYEGTDIGLDDTKWYDNQSEGILYINNILVGYKGNADNMPTELTIKDGTKCIADSALMNLDNLTAVKIPNSVTYIGSEAFFKCPNLKSINIPESVEVIENCALGYDEKVGWVGINYQYISEPIEDFEIHGKAGSHAETYAKENNFTFFVE